MSALPQINIQDAAIVELPIAEKYDYPLFAHLVESLLDKWKLDINTWKKELDYFSKMLLCFSPNRQANGFLPKIKEMVDKDLPGLVACFDQFEQAWEQRKSAPLSEVSQKKRLHDFKNLQSLISKLDAEFSLLKIKILDLFFKTYPLQFT